MTYHIIASRWDLTKITHTRPVRLQKVALQLAIRAFRKGWDVVVSDQTGRVLFSRFQDRFDPAIDPFLFAS